LRFLFPFTAIAAFATKFASTFFAVRFATSYTSSSLGRGRVTVEAVQRRIEAYYGTASERFTIGAMANRFGAVLRGEWLERVAS
jgi:hypothetical protein